MKHETQATTHATTKEEVKKSASKKLPKNLKLSVIHFTRTIANHEEFAFRSHQYVTIKRAMTKQEESQNLCVNTRIFMSLTDRKFVARNCLDKIIQRTVSKVTIREIEAQMHDSSKYVTLDFFVLDRVRDQQEASVAAHFTAEMHLVDNLKVNVLIEIDVMSSKQMIIDCGKKLLMISTCNDFETDVCISRKSQMTDRVVRAIVKTMISSESIVTIPIRIRERNLSKNRDYSFFSKSQRQLSLESEFFNHVMRLKMIEMQVRNIAKISFVILKNFEIDSLHDYREKETYHATFEDRHLAIASAHQINI
jgi:hypothetical protein